MTTNLPRRVAALEQAAHERDRAADVPAILILSYKPRDTITVGSECFNRNADEPHDAFKARVARAAGAMGCVVVLGLEHDEAL